jgi:putative transposase
MVRVRGRPRSASLGEVANLANWPKADVNGMDARTRAIYLSRVQAVEMYLQGCSLEQIVQAVGICNSEIRRYVARCLVTIGPGTIYGFVALIPGMRIKEYCRKNLAIGRDRGSRGGYAGALKKVFQTYPQVEENVKTLALQLPTNQLIHESRISYNNILRRFLADLKALGFSDNQWPFCTNDLGREALRQYVISLQTQYLSRWVGARCGDDAKAMGRLGTGDVSILRSLRPYTFVQLDYQVIDTASIILITNRHGVDIEMLLSRWYIGFVAEEHSHAILGVYATLELKPSGDSALTCVENAFRPEIYIENDPRMKFTPNNAAMINQLVPELAFQSFAGIKVDNDWANAATSVFNRIMDEVGCAVNFGPVRKWDRRHVIERIIQKITQEGAQRLQATYGTGPNDTRVKDPAKAAFKLCLKLSEVISIIYGCCFDHNTRITQGADFARPIEVLQAGLMNRASGFFSQPLPKQTQEEGRLLWAIEERTIKGNIEQHRRPYIAGLYCDYTNHEISSNYGLVNQRVVLHINRRNPDLAYATLKATHVNLGAVVPEARWRNCGYTLRERLAIFAWGRRHKLSEISPQTYDRWSESKLEEFAEKKERDRRKKSGQALKAAKREFDVQTAQKTSNSLAYPADTSPSTGAPALVTDLQTPSDHETLQHDPFGLFDSD